MEDLRKKKLRRSFLALSAFFVLIHGSSISASTKPDDIEPLMLNTRLLSGELAESVTLDKSIVSSGSLVAEDSIATSGAVVVGDRRLLLPQSLPSPYADMALQSHRHDDGTVRILVLCGGGVRGIMGLRFLQKLSEETGRSIPEMFHLVSGTSIGGITAAALNKQKEVTQDFSATSLFHFMRSNTKRMFKKAWSFGGLWGPRYQSKPTQDFSEEIFGNTKLTDCLTDTMIIAHDLVAARPFIFRSWDDREDFYLRDAALATSAAPTYFEPVRIFPIGTNEENHIGYDLSDGGTDANNSILCALTEAFKRYPGIKRVEAVVLGTGKSQHPLYYKSARKMGLLGWVGNIISMTMDGPSVKDNFIARSLIGSVIPGSYSAWNPNIPAENSALDNTAPTNIDALISFEDNLIRERAEEFRRLVSRLSKPKYDFHVAKSRSLRYA